MDRRDYLKPSRFGNLEKRRLLDMKNLNEKRKYRRTADFNQQRGIEAIAQEVKENNITKIVNPKKLALQKFKEEREAKKKSLKEKEKPPFVVGIPHHGSSPILKNKSTDNSKREKKGITPLKFAFNPQKSAKELTIPHTPTVLKRSAQKAPLKNVSNSTFTLITSQNHLQSDEAHEVLAAPSLISEDINDAKRQEEPTVGWTHVAEGQPDDIDGSPRSIFVNSAEPHGTPKSALKKSLTALSASTKKRTNLLPTITLSEEKIEETDEKNIRLTDNTKGSTSKRTRGYKKSLGFSPSENQQKSDSTTMPATEDILVPAFTPRRSMRLLTKLQPTPVRCIHCDSTSRDMSSSSSESSSSSKNHSVSPADVLQNTEFASFTIPDGTKGSASKSTSCYKKSFAFSPSENHKKSDSTTVPGINKPSTSDVKFSLRPSILTFTENNNFNDIPKKTKKRRQASVFTPSDTTTEIDTAGPRGSTRQSRKVTFETGAEEKPSQASSNTV